MWQASAHAVDDDDVMRFVVINEDVDSDEIYPIIERSVFKRNPLISILE